MIKSKQKINTIPDVSIVIVNWNTRDLLVSCLHSISTHIENMIVQVIVVDNASSDGSSSAVQKHFPEVALLQNKKNDGFARANNMGIRQSTGRYICLVNSDVVFIDNCLEVMINYMDTHPAIGILAPKLLHPDGTFQLSCKYFPTLCNNFYDAIGLHKLKGILNFFSGTEMELINDSVVQTVDIVAGAFWMIRRESLNDVGLLDENFFFYGEDLDFCKRCWNKGWQIVFFPKAQVVHHGGASSSKEPMRFRKELYSSKLKYWEKHRGRIGRLGFIFITLLNQMIRMLSSFLMFLLRPSGKNEIMKGMKFNIECINWLLRNL